MNPAKNRDRKCSTCRHYQPSPLWRKGWCRNPLLYDRNTNHLVEADSLACNRTFIDYWEPLQGPAPTIGTPTRAGNKPRIAPSIPIDTTDSKGRRGVVTGNTPAGGMAAIAANGLSDEDEIDALPGNREAPKLSLVTPDYEPNGPKWPDPASKATRAIPLVDGPDGPVEQSSNDPAAKRITAARRAQKNSFLKTTTGRIFLVVALLVLLGAAAGGYMVLKSKASTPVALAVTPTAAPTHPVPTPTGFGDATNTPVPTNTPKPPPANVMAVNGWAQVQSASGLSVRETPSKTGKRLTVIPNNTKGHIVDGPKDADGLKWWKIDHYDAKNPAAAGWVAGQFLVPTAAP